MIPSVTGARTLIVDDWEQGARAIQNSLTEDGITSVWARNSAEAIDMTSAAGFDLIVVNLALANEDPLKLVSALRASDVTHEVPLLLMAEPGEKDRILRGFELGANDWLVQPMDPNELRARREIRSAGSSTRIGYGPI